MKRWDAQGHKCAICGNEYPLEDLVADNILPWAKGGTTTEENLQMLCALRNGQKKDKYIRNMNGEAMGLRITVAP